MKKMTLRELVEKAHELNEKRIKWHNHFLTPKCIFNKEENYSVILEDETNGVVYYTTCEEKPTEEMKEIEKLFYLSIKTKGV